jgi:hypothetical protein
MTSLPTTILVPPEDSNPAALPLAIPPPNPRIPRMGDSFLKNLSNIFIPPYHS